MPRRIATMALAAALFLASATPVIAMPTAVAAVIVNSFLLATGITASLTTIAVATSIVAIGLTVGAAVLAQSFIAEPGGATRSSTVPPSDRKFISRSSVAPRSRSYGTVKISGTQVFIGAQAGRLYRVLAHGHGKVDQVLEHWIDDRTVSIDAAGVATEYADDGSGGSTPTDTFAPGGTPRVHIYWREGDASQSYYPDLESAFPDWGSAHRGDGVHHSLTIFTQVEQSIFLDTFPAAENTRYLQTVRASRVWDPRDTAQLSGDDSTWQWSENAALVILDYLRHDTGFGMPDEWLLPELESWKAAADKCDETVALKSGGTTKRYRTSGTYGFDQRPADVLKDLMTTCNAKITIADNGGLGLTVGAWVAPTVTIDDDAIVSYRIASGNEAPATANTITARYNEPEHGFIETDADPWVNAADVTARGEETADADLYFTPNHNQARRLLKQVAAMSAPEWRGSMITNLRALPIVSERFIRITSTDMDLDITVEIDDVEFIVDEGSVVTGLSFKFLSMDAEAFAFDAATEEGRAPEVPPDTAGSNALPVPTNLTIINENRGGSAVHVLNWSPLTFDFLSVEAQHRTSAVGPTPEGEWQTIGTAPAGEASIETGTLVDLVSYDYQIRSVGTTGRVSDWTAEVSATATIDSTAPSAVTGVTASALASDVTIDWTMPNSANVAGARIYRDTANLFAGAALIDTVFGAANTAETYEDAGLASNTYYYWVVSINGSNVESAEVATGAVVV